MSENTERSIASLSNVECPSWCTLPHTGEWLLIGDEASRVHEAARTQIGRMSVFVELYETAVEENDWRIEQPQGVSIVIDAEGNLTPAEARQLAAGLLNAADALDKIASTEAAS